MRNLLSVVLTDQGLAARLGVGTVVTLAFAAIARWLRGVTLLGALAGAVVCLAIYLGAGPWGFVALAMVFALTWLATRCGYERKVRMGIAEKREGRTASQVLANIGVAGVCAALAGTGWQRGMLLIACAAAMAEAAADTVSSEIGQASGQTPWLITTWKQVPAGTDGGISKAGSLAGAAAALLVSLVFIPAGLPWPWFLIAGAAGFAGMIADSYLGALLQRRKILANDSVNLISTLVAAGLAACVVVLAGMVP